MLYCQVQGVLVWGHRECYSETLQLFLSRACRRRAGSQWKKRRRKAAGGCRRAFWSSTDRHDANTQMERRKRKEGRGKTLLANEAKRWRSMKRRQITRGLETTKMSGEKMGAVKGAKKKRSGRQQSNTQQQQAATAGRAGIRLFFSGRRQQSTGCRAQEQDHVCCSRVVHDERSC